MAGMLDRVVLWSMAHEGNAVRCVVMQHPLGHELRYLLNDRPLISRVFQDWHDLNGQAQLWRDGLESRGWSDSDREERTH